MADAELSTPGPLLASGRAADVYDIGDGRVLRRYRKPVDAIDYEQRVMRYVADQGIRVPTVFDLDASHHADRDIVMERIDGITMLDDFEARPWKLFSHIRLLAKLQREINDLVAPDWMVTPITTTERSKTSTTTITSTVAASEQREARVLHLDLHPMNIMLTDGDPVVIGWTNAAGGPAGFDAALTYVEMATFEIEGFAQQMGARIGVEVFKRARGATEIEAFMVAACEHRLADSGITPGERTAVAALRAKALTRHSAG